MLFEGYIKSTIAFLVYGGSLLTMINSCASLNTPRIFNQKPLITHNFPTNEAISTKWALDSLTPIENTVLARRRKVAVSCYMEAHGDGNYLLQLSSDRKIFKPLPYILNNAGGQIDFTAYISWYIKPKGKTETISVTLYDIEKSKSGKTVVCTLIKQIRRTFDVKRQHK